MVHRILIVEDEMTIAFMIEDMLISLGHEVVEIAMRLPEALEVARRVEADLAILDVNLDGLRSFPVAEVLEERGIPLVSRQAMVPWALRSVSGGTPSSRSPFVWSILKR
jgi:DNA-binding response OmpR family regulator